MSCWDVDEIVELAEKPIMCPSCVNGAMTRGWNKEYKPVRARVITNATRGGHTFHALFQKVIMCKKHGEQIKEVEM